MDLESKTLRVVILNRNLFISDVIREILKKYDHELMEIKSLDDLATPCDILIIYEDGLNEDLVNKITLLPKTSGIKVLVCNENKSIPKNLIPFLNSIVYIDELDVSFKEFFDYYSFLKGQKSFEEEINILNKLVKDTEKIFENILRNSKNLREYFSNKTEANINCLIQFENLVKEYKAEFTSYEHFNFVDKLPFVKTDINKLIENILEEKKDILRSKLREVKFIPDYVLDNVFINPIVLSKLVKNLIDLILFASNEPKDLFIEVKKTLEQIQIRFEINCEEYDNRYKMQIYNPFFPRRILENYLINYFRIKIEKYHRIFIRDFFINKKLVFLIILEVDS